MDTQLAGLAFDVGPDAVLTIEERHALERLGPGGGPPVLRLDVRDGAGTPSWPTGVPAEIGSTDGRTVRVRHAAFEAEIDPRAGWGWLRRAPGPAFPLEITLRVSLAACLPASGGVPFHAAGIVVDGTAVAFFGVSGAGKSTLASGAPYPVLSDELVALFPGEKTLAASGFWGELGERDRLRRRYPLAALVALAKGDVFRWEPLAPPRALPRLIEATLVPPAAQLWSQALAVLGRAARGLPVYRMEWSPAAPPWAEIARRVAALRAPA